MRQQLGSTAIVGIIVVLVLVVRADDAVGQPLLACMPARPFNFELWCLIGFGNRKHRLTAVSLLHASATFAGARQAPLEMRHPHSTAPAHEIP